MSMALTARVAADVAQRIISRSPRLRDVMCRSADSVTRDWIVASTSTGLTASRLQSYDTDETLPLSTTTRNHVTMTTTLVKRPFSTTTRTSRYQNVSVLNFTVAKDNGGGGDSCQTVKLSPPTNQYPAFLQAGCPSRRPTNSATFRDFLPQVHLGVFQTTKGSRSPWGGLPSLSSTL